MPTRQFPRSRRMSLLAPIVAAIALGSPLLAAAGASDQSGITGAAQLPARDVARLALADIAVEGAATSLISHDQARAAADEQYKWDAIGATIDEYLGTVSVLGTIGTPGEVRSRPMWIFHATGLKVVKSGPIRGDGSTAPSPVLSQAYEFVDAFSGEYVMTLWVE